MAQLKEAAATPDWDAAAATRTASAADSSTSALAATSPAWVLPQYCLEVSGVANN